MADTGIRLTNGTRLPNTDIYHETSGIRDMMGNGTAQGLNVSTNPDLALGQSGKGVTFQYDGAKLLGDRGYLRPIQKPGTPLVGQQEFEVLGGNTSSGLKSITIKPGVKLDAVEKRILRNQFDHTLSEDGLHVFTPKTAAAGVALPELLNGAAGVIGAGQMGWQVGRVLGQTPLITDPNTTYDQFYQQQMQGAMEAAARKRAMIQVQQGQR